MIMPFIEELRSLLYLEALPWLLRHSVSIIIIIVVALVAKKFLRLLVEKIIRKVVRSSGPESKASEKQREDTLIEVFNYALGIAVIIIALLMILAQIGINIGPLIAGAGIVGIALGFGGQYLIRDIIAGFFIILENQYRVGDVVKINDKSGLVEEVTLRMTVLRDLDGTVHHVPNGEITTSSNMSKEFARVNLDIGISYDSDLEKVIKVVDEVGKELAKDKDFKEDIISPMHFVRVNEFGDSAIIIKILGETRPLKQWATAGEFRKRLKIAFDKNGIVIPFPQRVIHNAK